MVRATVSGDWSTGKYHCPFVERSSNPASPMEADAKSVLSFNLPNTVHLALEDSLRACPSQVSSPGPSFFQWLLHRNGLPRLTLQTHSEDYKPHRSGGCPRLVLLTFSKVLKTHKSSGCPRLT